MTEVQFDDLDRFVSYAQKHFELSLLAGCLVSERCDPKIPSRAVGLSLLLGEVAHIPSLRQLDEETKLPQWQRWVGYHERISHDAFGYASNRMDPEQLRRAGVFINKSGQAVITMDENGYFTFFLHQRPYEVAADSRAAHAQHDHFIHVAVIRR